MAAKRDQFGSDRHGDLLRGHGPDIESDRRMNPAEQMSGQALFLQRLKDTDDLALGADHADVARTRLHGPAQDAHVVAVAASDNHNIGRFVGLELPHSLIELERVYFAGGREALLGSVRRTVVGDDNVEAGWDRCPAKIDRHMTCTEKVK